MIYPDFLNKNDTIGITACSCGIKDKIEKYEKALVNINKNGFKVIETDNVRTNGLVSSSKEIRWKELKSLYENKDVKLISIAAGGDLLSEMLPLVEDNIIKNNIKWISGSSDPTSLLYLITCKYDIATIYSPCNICGFAMEHLHESLSNYFSIIKGENVEQNKFYKYELNGIKDSDEYNLDTINSWININGEVNTKGRIIGGCIDSLKDIIGTKFDYTKEFINKYKSDNIIWYFDVFALSGFELYNTLNQFYYSGWFDYTDTILISKVKYPSEHNDLSYIEAITRFFSDKSIKCIYQYDIGHVHPSFTVINGSMVNIISNNIDRVYSMKNINIKEIIWNLKK